MKGIRLRKMLEYNQLCTTIGTKVKQFFKNPDNHTLADLDLTKIETTPRLFSRFSKHIVENIPSKEEIDIFNINDVGVLPSEFFRGIEEWKFTRLVNAEHMFDGQRNFNSDISKWNLSYLIIGKGMFNECETFNKNLNDTGICCIKDMENMFNRCYELNQPFYKWKTSKLERSKRAFAYCRRLNQDFNDWDISSLVNCVEMFLHCSSLEDGISSWNLDYSTGIDYDGILGYCENNINV